MADDKSPPTPRSEALKILWGDISPSLIAPALLILALTIAFMIVSERNHSTMQQNIAARQLMRDNLDVVTSLELLLLNAETGQRGYLLTGNENYLAPLNKAREELPKVQQKMATTFDSRPDRQPYVEQLVKLARDKFIELERTVALAKQSKRDEALIIIAQNSGREQMDEARKQIAEMITKMEDELAALRNRTQYDMSLARFGALSTALLNILLLGYALYLFMRDLKQRQMLIKMRENENQRLNGLVEERTAELNELSSHLQRSTEQDRAALARDLHDELGGLLTSAKMDLAWLESHATHEPEAIKRFDQLNAILDEAVSIKRRVIENLRPSLLDHLGLAPALEWYISDQCSKAGLSCTLNLAEELGHISPDAAIALFRIVQEATTNTLRHAKAKNFTTSLHADETNIHLLLVDDGDGLPATFNPAKLSHGLSGIRQRARALGGDAAWRSSPSGGTTIEVIIPREVQL